MYFKLALRNARRSLFDYLLYITTTVILLLFMYVSNYAAIIANVEAGFQTVSLPLLISTILIVLVSYINKFMLRQRSKEFANYILLGMEKNKLVKMFLCEFCIIGFLCFMISSLAFFGVCYVLSNTFQFAVSKGLNVSPYFQSLGYTFLYFCIIECFSMFRMRKRICKFEISDLMIEKKRNQRIGGKKQCYLWGSCFFINLLILVVILCGLVFLPNGIIMTMISFIFIPITLTVFSFYKCLYYCASLIRQRKPESLYQKERLYMIAKITAGANTDTTMNSIFCICLFLSSMSFLFGVFMLQTKNLLFDEVSQKWMGFMQICLCTIFIVIYFSILSLQQIIDIQQQKKEFKILHYLGKSQKQLKKLVMKQILVKLFFPTIMCFILLGASLPFLNYKLNNVLPVELSNFWLKSLGIFVLGFLILYFLYFFIVFIVSKNIVKVSTNEY